MNPENDKLLIAAFVEQYYDLFLEFVYQYEQDMLDVEGEKSWELNEDR